MPDEKKPLPQITLANLRPPYPDFDYFADAAENPFRNEVRSLLPLDPARGLDPNFFNLIPNALDDHVPTLYATHIWNAYVEEQGV
jgi:hypothetical protein